MLLQDVCSRAVGKAKTSLHAERELGAGGEKKAFVAARSDLFCGSTHLWVHRVVKEGPPPSAATIGRLLWSTHSIESHVLSPSKQGGGIGPRAEPGRKRVTGMKPAVINWAIVLQLESPPEETGFAARTGVWRSE